MYIMIRHIIYISTVHARLSVCEIIAAHNNVIFYNILLHIISTMIPTTVEIKYYITHTGIVILRRVCTTEKKRPWRLFGYSRYSFLILRISI